jgi:CheY-like chemotaxis protein
VKRWLTRSGYQVDTADGAAAAVASAECNHYALIASDLNMPGQNGIELLRLLRPLQPHATLVLISGQDCQNLRSPAYLVLQKPWTAFELKRILDAAVDRQAHL